ncbi:MAG: SPOR domain-containing protein [Terricaulis sp.]
MTTRYDQRLADDQTRFSGMVYVLMVVVALAFGGFVWQLYSAPDVPRISAQPGPYKIEPDASAALDTVEAGALHESNQTPPVATEAVAAEAPAGAPQLAPSPTFVANGPYVAQLAALQSAAAADVAWARLSSRAPALFAVARLDVERADLGQRGVYYRVRAGYFADRVNAARFCERIRQMGQDCIAAAR